MINIIVYIAFIILFIIFQYSTFTKLTLFQFSEMIFGSFFIIIFFGLFGALLSLNKELTNLSIYGATFYMIWYYVTKKIVNGMNSDKNGVIYFN
jgi:hypothetical protein